MTLKNKHIITLPQNNTKKLGNINDAIKMTPKMGNLNKAATRHWKTRKFI